MKTTWYNHVQLGDDEKPLIPNKEFKTLCEELNKGNFKMYDEYDKKYTMVMDQHKLAKQIIEKINK